MTRVLVVCEVKDGKLTKMSSEVLTAGRGLSEAMGGELVAAAFGSAASGIGERAGAYGSSKVFVVSDGALDGYLTDNYAAALASVVSEASPSVVLFGASAMGKDLAPRIAARLSVGVASEVISLDYVDGKVRAKRPVYSGRAIATVEVTGVPAVATCRSNAFAPSESGGGMAEIVEIAFVAPPSRSRLVETRSSEGGEVSLSEADVIVSGGRGLKEADNFKLIQDLAAELGAAAGASRAIVDSGWVDHQRQVGQTGRVVSPNLYVAIGISGAIQHLAGMQSSKHIVAINKDGEAPIFKVADLGVIGDLFEVVPALTAEIHKAKAG